MKDRIEKTCKNLLHEFYRLQLMLYLVIFSILLLDYIGLSETSGWRYRWHKANIVSTGVIIAHFAWSQLIFYWDNREALSVNPTSTHEEDFTQAIKAAGMMIFRGIFYYAIIISYSSGL